MRTVYDGNENVRLLAGVIRKAFALVADTSRINPTIFSGPRKGPDCGTALWCHKPTSWMGPSTRAYTKILLGMILDCH